MVHKAQLRGVWRRRLARALPALLLIGLGGLALAIDLRTGATRRLDAAEQDFAAAFGREALARVQAALDRPPELAQRLTAAVASDLLDPVESKRLFELASAETPPAALAGWRARCDRLLATMDRTRQAPAVAVVESAGSRPGRAAWRSGETMRTITSVQACGLAAAAQGERAAAIVAVELLGALARNLEAWPQRLSLMVGVHAEKGQLDLVKRLRGGADRAERSRILAALSPEDLPRRHRDAIAGEVLHALDGWHARRPPGQQSLEAWYLAPFEAGAYVRALTRYLVADERPPSWPDSIFADAHSQGPFLEKEQARQGDLSVRREDEHHALAE